MAETQNSLESFEGVRKFKSVGRAIRRGHVSPYGVLYPRRPFNNRKNRPLEEVKKRIYNEIKERYGGRARTLSV